MSVRRPLAGVRTVAVAVVALSALSACSSTASKEPTPSPVVSSPAASPTAAPSAAPSASAAPDPAEVLARVQTASGDPGYCGPTVSFLNELGGMDTAAPGSAQAKTLSVYTSALTEQISNVPGVPQAFVEVFAANAELDRVLADATGPLSEQDMELAATVTEGMPALLDEVAVSCAKTIETSEQ